jgi:hypothetical protein
LDIGTAIGVSRSLSELHNEVARLRENYGEFTKHNQKFLLLEDDFQTAFETAEAEINFRRKAQTFGDGISSAIRTIERKQKHRESNWTAKVGKFLKTLYPVATLSLGVASSVGEVNFSVLLLLIIKGITSLPLKSAAATLGIILQVRLRNY